MRSISWSRFSRRIFRWSLNSSTVRVAAISNCSEFNRFMLKIRALSVAPVEFLLSVCLLKTYLSSNRQIENNAVNMKTRINAFAERVSSYLISFCSIKNIWKVLCWDSLRFLMYISIVSEFRNLMHSLFDLRTCWLLIIFVGTQADFSWWSVLLRSWLLTKILSSLFFGPPMTWNSIFSNKLTDNECERNLSTWTVYR